MTKITDLYIRENGLYTCKTCKKVTTYASTMHYHIANSHLEEKSYKCIPCEKGFVQKGLYLKHLALMHPDSPHPSATEKNPYAGTHYQCGGCDHTSTTKGNCLIHYARTHASWIPAYKKDSSCTGCDTPFASSTAYLHHAIYCFPVPGKTEENEIAKTVEVRTI